MPKRDASGWTRNRVVRVPDDVWAAAQAQAREDGRTVTEVIITALERYGRKQRQRAARERKGAEPDQD